MASGKYENNALRKNEILYLLRALQFIFALSTLGVAASDASNWLSYECSVPPKLAYNLATPVLTIFIVGYLLLTTGTVAKICKCLPWAPWFQLSAEILLCLLWLTTGGVISSFTCTDVCNSCSNYYYIDSCVCENNIDNFRKRKSPTSTITKAVSDVADKIGLDWTMFLLVLVSLIFTSYMLWRESHPPPATEGQVETVVVEAKTADGPTQPPAQAQGEVPYQPPPQPAAAQVPAMASVQTEVQGTPAYQAPVPNPVPEYHAPGPNAVSTPEYHP